MHLGKLADMDTLFPMEPVAPKGFSYSRDFLSRDEEAQLLQAIASTELHTFIFHGYEAKRRVASFGYDYEFDSGALKRSRSIPSSFTWLIEKVSSHTGIPPTAFAEMLITEYPIGAVINWHRDAPPFETVAGLSLGASCTFRFRPYDKARQARNSIVSLQVEPRSLYIIEGEAREAWEHSTLPVKKVRYSITLRTLRPSKRS